MASCSAPAENWMLHRRPAADDRFLLWLPVCKDCESSPFQETRGESSVLLRISTPARIATVLCIVGASCGAHGMSLSAERSLNDQLTRIWQRFQVGYVEQYQKDIQRSVTSPLQLARTGLPLHFQSGQVRRQQIDTKQWPVTCCARLIRCPACMRSARWLCS